MWKCNGCGKEFSTSSGTIPAHCPKCGNREIYVFEPKILTKARECLLRGSLDESRSLLKETQTDYPALSETCAQLRHDICVAYIARSEAAMSTSEWQKAKDLAQKALDVEPNNSDAERIRIESADKLQLKTLASLALSAYRRRDLDGCKNACDALLSYQQSSGRHVDIADASGNAIDFNNLHWKLNHEIAIQREAERQQLVEQARVRKAIIMGRFRTTTVTCVIIALVIFGLGHWRKVRLEKQVLAFEIAMKTHAFDNARAMAPDLAGKYKIAADLLAYYKTRELFETALTTANAELLIQYGAEKWKTLQTLKQSAEVNAIIPVEGIEIYQRAIALLAECQNMVLSGEKARRENEAREKAMVEAKAREDRQQTEANEKRQANEKNELKAGILKDYGHLQSVNYPSKNLAVELASFDSNARDKWQMAANQGWPEAQWLLGASLMYGAGGVTNKNRAMELWSAAASQKLARAQFDLGLLQTLSKDKRRIAEGISWLNLASDQGLAFAQEYLGKLYYEGTLVSQDRAKSVALWREAAEQRSSASQVNLAKCLLFGIGTPKDTTEAANWLLRAAVSSNAFAAHMVGQLFSAGVGLPKNNGMALKWYTIAASNGNESAQNDLGHMHLTGDLAIRDLRMATKWLSMAADQGDPNAQCTVGALCFSGNGFKRDHSIAARLYLKAGQNGISAAQCSLGILYRNGWGLPRNWKEAEKWFQLAALQGDPTATASIRDMKQCQTHAPAQVASTVVRDIRDTCDLILSDIKNNRDEKNIEDDLERLGKIAVSCEAANNLKANAVITYALGLHFLGHERRGQRVMASFRKSIPNTEELRENPFEYYDAAIKQSPTREALLGMLQRTRNTAAEIYDPVSFAATEFSSKGRVTTEDVLHLNYVINFHVEGTNNLDAMQVLETATGQILVDLAIQSQKARTRGFLPLADADEKEFAERTRELREQAERQRAQQEKDAADMCQKASVRSDLETVITSIREALSGTRRLDARVVSAPEDLRTAADRGWPDAQALRGLCSMFGLGGFKKDRDEAMSSLLKAANQGHAYAQYQLGLAYGGDRDEENAAKFHRAAAEQGLAEAQFMLGGMYAEGVGLPKNEATAVEWWRKAAEQNHMQAQNNLGQFYVFGGVGVPQDREEAVRWLRKAASAGSADATKTLVEMNVPPSGWLYKCSNCGRVEKYREKVKDSVCSQCIGVPADMQYLGPTY